MSIDLTEYQRELLARVLQHGGVLAAPFGHPGDDTLEEALMEDVDALEAEGLIMVERSRGHEAPERLSLTEAGYDALGMS
ncbi:hypothetical protein RSO68_04465 [Halomonas saccharevitans]|uniref:Uncharacterized protein n=1 Tax=Halomonas saccharevitans TaxID=416872 RepID=A0A1I6YT02_9GAMM|nr:hypothetical protein [Halomonas saccharevitans]MDT8878713.1 hypothetical protein [Halomonas saccharevitans]SFT53595.1 hypothetical protein SAMN04487956_1072 [Halomonas saccharevitans]